MLSMVISSGYSVKIIEHSVKVAAMRMYIHMVYITLCTIENYTK